MNDLFLGTLIILSFAGYLSIALYVLCWIVINIFNRLG